MSYDHDANLQRVACRRCGAFVSDESAHDQFHALIDRIASILLDERHEQVDGFYR